VAKLVHVIGAGLAGCEAAWQIASLGVNVKLYEMKPSVYSPAHHSDKLAELVCSNSFKASGLENATGLLKEELKCFNSIIVKCAYANTVPAGGALAVDREAFSESVTQAIKSHPLIEFINQEIKMVDSFPSDEPVIIATGPLTSDSLASDIINWTGLDGLSFYDAAAPVISYDSIDMTKAFKGSRYGKGSDDYINCPMNKDEYAVFYDALINAEAADIKGFDDIKVYEGCMPVETMAKRGKDTLRFGPLKPVGLLHPDATSDHWAVVQLRQDNLEGTLYNLVGFQTRLKFGEQKRVFSLIPGLESAEFERYGVMHRNTYVKAPGLLDQTYRAFEHGNVFFAGQITGVEGYIESTSSGLVAGINAAMIVLEREKVIFPANTAIGALSHYIANFPGKNFQPMGINFGIIQSDNYKIRDKKERKLLVSKLALEEVGKICSSLGLMAI